MAHMKLLGGKLFPASIDSQNVDRSSPNAARCERMLRELGFSSQLPADSPLKATVQAVRNALESTRTARKEINDTFAYAHHSEEIARALAEMMARVHTEQRVFAERWMQITAEEAIRAEQ